VPRTLLTPRWLVLHALTIAVVVAMIWLGQWQYDAGQAGRERDNRQRAAAVPLDELARPGEPVPDSSVDRTASVSGTYDVARQVTVPGRVLDRTMGAYVVTPLTTSTGSTLLVVRGWVADGAQAEDPPRAVELTGTIRPYEDSSDATLGLSARYAPGELPYLGPEPVQDAISSDAARTYGGFLALESQDPTTTGAPRPVPLDVLAPQSGVGIWQHFSYWAQWWVFAAAAVVFWAVLARNAVRRERQDQDA